MDMSFGLDFGTTNSTLSVHSESGVRLLDVDKGNEDNPKILRSVLYFNPDKQVSFGREAIANYIDEGGEGRFMRSIKAFLPNLSFTGTFVYGKMYKIEDLVSLILKTMKRRGEEQLGTSVDRVVIGRPVVFSEDAGKDKKAEDRLRRAAELAGFKQISFQLEPIAAALEFESSLPDDRERVVLVGDFGGGTSDFTIMKLRRGSTGRNRQKDILALGGAYIGGDSFDSLLMWEKMARHFGRGVHYQNSEGKRVAFPPIILNNLRHWHTIPQLLERKTRQDLWQIKGKSDNPEAVANLERLVESNSGFLLFQAIEEAKCELSSNSTATIAYEGIREVVTLEQFEDIISEKTELVDHCVEEVLAKANLGSGDIDQVFITGGSSKIPCIRRIFEGRFGAEKLREQEAFTSVGYGLGVSAAMDF